MHMLLKVACCLALGVEVDAVRYRRTLQRNISTNSRMLQSEISTNSSKLVDGDGNQFQVYIPTTQAGSCEAVLFSVGTAMGATGYNSLASALTAKGFIVAIVDPERGSMTKNNVDKLRKAYSFAKDNLASWSDGSCGSISKWLLGGHSAGGGTAHKVLAMDPSMADGVFSVDAFTNSGLGDYVVNLPSLHWGFDFTTCFVTKEEAGVAHYALTETSKRIFVRIQKVDVSCWFGRSPLYKHCAITDSGCPACSSCKATPQHFYDDVAESVDTFSKAFARSDWSKDTLSLKFTTPVDSFVAEDV